MLVIAHPDDEVMFFGPTLLNLNSSKLFILCLSTCEFKRIEEFYKSCNLLTHPDHCIFSESNEFLDGFENKWNESLIIDVVQKYINQFHIKQIITFDKDGVSGHPNHCAIGRSLSTPLIINGSNIDIYQLKSKFGVLKYMGTFGTFMYSKIIYHPSFNNNIYFTPKNKFQNKTILKIFSAHKSQQVFYRSLWMRYCIFTEMNQLDHVHE